MQAMAIITESPSTAFLLSPTQKSFQRQASVMCECALKVPVAASDVQTGRSRCAADSFLICLCFPSMEDKTTFLSIFNKI